ncbi:MAG: DUF481 domain-containing protein [Pirellulaceae bacterium]
MIICIVPNVAEAQTFNQASLMPPYASPPGPQPTFLPPVLAPVEQTDQSARRLSSPSGTPYTVPVQTQQQAYAYTLKPPNRFPDKYHRTLKRWRRRSPSAATTQVAANQNAPYASLPEPLPYTLPTIESGDPSQAIGSGANIESLPPPPDSVPSAMSPTHQADSAASPMMTPIMSEAFESEPEYAWYQYPWVWIPRDGWDSSIEFGLNGSEGNTNSLSYAAGADLTRKGNIYNLNVNLDYRKTQANGVDTQDNARANFDLDRAIAESAMSAFIKSGLEYDVFKAFDARVNVNSGISYFWANTDDVTFVTRLGAGASKEVGAVDEDWKPEMLFGLDLKQQVNDRNRVFAKVDYFPAFEDFNDFRVVTDAGWEILLDDTDNFSLKLAATNRYDSTPLGLEPQDIDYTATLLYKF